MPTIIDSLIMTLGLDTKDYDAGSQKVDKSLKATGASAEAAGKKLKQTGADGAAGFNTLAKSAIKFLALLGSTFAVKQFVQQTIESSAALDRLAKNLGEATESLSAWGNAAEIAGGTSKGLEGTMGMLSKAQTDLRLTGESSLIPYFSMLHVAMADTAGKARPVSDILLDLADRFSKMDRRTAFNIGQRMGIDEGTMNLLLQGRQQVEAMIRAQKEYNAVTEQQAEQYSHLLARLVGMGQSFEALGRRVLSDAMPYLEKILDVLNGLGDWIKANSTFVEAFLTILAVGIAAVVVAALPFTGTAAAILAVAAAIAALYDDYKTWQAGGKTLIDWDSWAPGIKSAIDAIANLRETFSSMYEEFKEKHPKLAAVLEDLGGGLKIYGQIILESTVESFKQLFSWVGKVYGVLGQVGDWVLGYLDKLAEKMPKDWITNKMKEGQDTVHGFWQGRPTVPESGPAKEREASAMAYFQSQGWSKEQAAGIVANIKTESGFNPQIPGDNGKAYGIGQWHSDRQANFQKVFGHPIQQSTYEEQLAFVQWELTHTEKSAGDALKGAQTAQQSGGIVSNQYERPADIAGESQRRGELAQSLMGFPGASAAAAGAGAAESAQSKAASQSGTIADNSDRSTETNIGTMVINTQATDSDGIAKSMKQSVDYLFTSQANYGLA
jgi:hypothetical protein